MPVLSPGRKKTKTGRIWTSVRHSRNAGSSNLPAAWFAYSPDLQGKHPQQHLRQYSGVLQADAYGGYDRLFSAEREGGALIEAACWPHARRKIHDVYISTQTATAEIRPSLHAYEYDGRTPSIIYPSGEKLCWVSTHGNITVNGNNVFLSQALRGEYVWLEETESDRYLIRFSQVKLAYYDRVKQRITQLEEE